MFISYYCNLTSNSQVMRHTNNIPSHPVAVLSNTHVEVNENMNLKLIMLNS